MNIENTNLPYFTGHQNNLLFFHKGFVIAYTSDFIPRMVYQYKYSPTDDLTGYIDASLSGRYSVWVLPNFYAILPFCSISVFNTSDYREDMRVEDDHPPETCQYRGKQISILQESNRNLFH